MKKAEAMQRLSECMRLQRLSRNTIKAYSDWLDRYITFLAGCHARKDSRMLEIHCRSNQEG